MSTINFGSMQRHITYINLDVWNKFPQELKDIWNQVDKDAQEFYLQLADEDERNGLKAMLAAGCTLVEFKEQNKLKAVVPDMITEWVTYADKLGHGANARVLEKHIRKCIKDSK